MTPIEELKKEELKKSLDELGVEHEDAEISVGEKAYGATTYWECGDVVARFSEKADAGTLLEAWDVSPEQAIDVTVGDKPKDNPRNYNPDGTPKIPNMHIGADPDWVDWVARLKHEEPLSLKEAVEQLMFEIICFGGDMGPNDCGGEHCPDEGMVYTNDFINGWVSKIAATVGTEPDEATMLKLHDRMNAALLDYEGAMGIDGGSGANTVPFVNEMHQIIEDAATVGVGTCHDADVGGYFVCSECEALVKLHSIGRSYVDRYGKRWYATSNNHSLNFCPNCGRRIEV